MRDTSEDNKGLEEGLTDPKIPKIDRRGISQRERSRRRKSQSTKESTDKTVESADQSQADIATIPTDKLINPKI